MVHVSYTSINNTSSMKIKYLLIVLAMVAITKTGFAQFSQDVLRYSLSEPGATARIKAIGNAGTAIGGDLSSVSGNPAGIGFFTHTEGSITPEFNSTGVNGTYLGQSTNSNSNTLNFNNASVVFYSKLNTPAGTDKGKGWLSLNFGLGYNRSSDFYENINYQGTNKNNSITNYFADLANTQGVDPSGNGSSLQDFAYGNGLIDLYSNGSYLSNVFNTGHGAPNQPVNQSDNTIRQGGQTEFSFAVGGNYSNKLYLGAGLGIANIRYTLSQTFTEIGSANILDQNNNPVVANFNSAYSQVESTNGTGFNLRAGFIYKPIDEIRIGGSFTSPTWYTMQDDYAEGLTTVYSGGATGTGIGGPTDYQTTYSFHTPLRVSGGIAVFLGHSGFITGDIEYVDYSSIRTSTGDGYPTDNVNADNHDIETNYKSTANIHVGGELKVEDDLYLRAGYGVQGDPVKNFGTNINTISGGIGYRFSAYYIDFTYTNVNGTQQVSPYTINAGGAPVASLDKTSNNVFVTLGMKF